MTTQKTIPLTKGQVATVDAADYDWLMQWKWYANWKPGPGVYYACRKEPRNGISASSSREQRTVMMHRVLLGEPPCMVDHRDTDTLNNKRSNLRLANKYQNQYNRRKMKTNKSGYTGVCFSKKRACWIAYVSFNGRLKYAGSASTAKAAASKRNKLAMELHGEFFHA